MKLLLVLCVSILAVNAASDADLWTEFKETHSKTYKNLVEEKFRFAIFQSNLRTIDEHNAKYERGEKSYFLKVNQFADLTDEEFKSNMLTYKKIEMAHNKTFELPEGIASPNQIDWREKGAVLEVKDQGHCGSCWAFSTTGALEGQNAIKHGIRVSLSEEELVDCSSHDSGCYSGYMITAFKYVSLYGISTGSSYPYTASDGREGQCSVGKDSGIKVTGYMAVPPTEMTLKQAVAHVGPISVSINGDGIRFYGGGIFDDSECEKSLNHGVLAVGYGSKDGLDFWIVKNSWGTGWGEKGFFRIARNKKQQCGLSTDNSFPIIL